MSRIPRILSHVTYLIAGILVLSGCKSTRIDSTWRDQVIAIDGQDQEWQNAQIIPEGQRIALGIANDHSALYISLRTADHAVIRQVLSFGFTVWIDPRGGTRERLGFRYPVVEDMRGMREALRNRRMMSGEDMDHWFNTVLANQFGIEIEGPGKGDLARLPLKNENGLEIAAGYHQGQFVYEARIPFQQSPHQEFAIATRPGRTVGIGFQTGRPDLFAMRGRGSVGMGGMPPGGGIGGMRPPGGGMGGGGMQPRTQPGLEVWTKVTLAQPD
ncbi:MAG: hypothetical protein JSU61_05820 [Fidelibacterota bacterium]|nr:MAG: hypothetical protein JSU61_05820 [Candidatus Neomarinimicrobiota bacterium]